MSYIWSDRKKKMNNKLELWVIFDHPKDYPNYFVVRVFLNNQPTDRAFLCNSLESARKVIPSDKFCIQRDPNDDPVIVETWI
jgi:hypothetical protein